MRINDGEARARKQNLKADDVMIVLSNTEETINPRGMQWRPGEVVDVDTEDGMEFGAVVLGPSSRGDDADEMSARFADGVIDDWSTAEFCQPTKICQPTKFCQPTKICQPIWQICFVGLLF
jgi:hypothetical protein